MTIASLRSSLLALFIFFGMLGYAQEDGTIIPGRLMISLEKGSDPASLTEDLAHLKGSKTGLEAKKTLSRYLNVRLFTYDTGQVDRSLLLERIRSHESVRMAQFEHRMERRATPNDPLFTQPDIWPYINNGSNGGVVDADIDADSAWEMTTGGTTVYGDTIVVAVIDGGFQLDHEDLNFYQNPDEVNGSNGVDDDGNGFVDDVNGWDAYNDDGTIPSDAHGTHVAGTVGAIGDNGTGWVGVNWDVEILPVAGSSTNESIVVSAYDYVVRMRDLYDSTDGQKGAFVVATNSSFGVNGGDPSNYPIWCAMYDTLGAYGITNAVAGPNNDVDIDSQGDVPGTCPSPHTICLTNTENDDSKAAAGYGDKHVDLGAPGTDILSTEPSDSYGKKSGTSMASPHVAGALGLLHSVDCPDFQALVESDPDSASRLVKEAILKGVDTTSAMTNITVSDGRLNLHKALLMLDTLGYCDTTNSCFDPYLLDAEPKSDTSAVLKYETAKIADSVKLRFRELDSSNWNSVIPDSIGPLSIDSGLLGCTEYEFQVKGYCGSDSSSWSDLASFQTLGCCNSPSSIQVDSTASNLLYLAWDSVYGASSYELRYRPIGASTWTKVSDIHGTDTSIQELQECETYELELRTDCDTAFSAYSKTLEASTLCSPCASNSYCDSKGQNTDYEWIERVELGDIDKKSGNNGGYLFESGPNTSLWTDSSYVFTLTPGFDGNICPCAEYFKVWVDLDRSGSFEEPGELLYESSSVNSVLTDTLDVPDTLTPGGSRMRISMRYDDPPSLCNNVDNGEVEDYCVHLKEGDPSSIERSGSENDKIDVELFPNPAHRSVQVHLDRVPSKGTYLLLYDAMGSKVMKRAVKGRKTRHNIQHLSDGSYFYRIVGENEVATGKLLIEGH